jgi:hypothetical protein
MSLNIMTFSIMSHHKNITATLGISSAHYAALMTIAMMVAKIKPITIAVGGVLKTRPVQMSP